MAACSILGELPSYLEQFDPEAMIEENVKATILRSNTYPSEEPSWLLLEDLRRDTVYGSILRMIPELRQSRSSLSLYWIGDAYLDFWYRFVDPSQSLVARGLGERLWTQSIAPELPRHISRPTFERACRQYLWSALAAENLPPGLSFTDVGTLWGAAESPWIAIFSRSGFSDRLRDLATGQSPTRLLLVGLNNMYGEAVGQ